MISRIRFLLLVATLGMFLFGVHLLSIQSRFADSTVQYDDMFFKNKYITEDGIYPLPVRPSYSNARRSDSVIPQRFFRKKPDVSKHDYRWMLNPYKTCVDKTANLASNEVFLLVAIASASWEFERRNLIRQTWGSVSTAYGKHIKFVFFVGKDRESNKIKTEFTSHHDIVMEDFAETYKNLTIKTQGQLKWATYFCPNARYFMHVDDDVFVDIRGIVKHLFKQPRNRLMHCGKVFMPKVRREGKWKMEKQEYTGNQYPLSCVGWCFVLSSDVVSDIYFISIDTHLIHLEDVTFTGILRERIGDLSLQKIARGEILCQHKGWPKDKPVNDKLKQAWEELKAKEMV